MWSYWICSARSECRRENRKIHLHSLFQPDSLRTKSPFEPMQRREKNRSFPLTKEKECWNSQLTNLFTVAKLPYTTSHCLMSNLRVSLPHRSSITVSKETNFFGLPLTEKEKIINCARAKSNRSKHGFLISQEKIQTFTRIFQPKLCDVRLRLFALVFVIRSRVILLP